MVAQLELDTYQHLIAYLSGGKSLKDFRQWFDAATWESAADSDLIGQIELGLAELSSGHRTESEFKEILHCTVPNLTLEIKPLQISTLQSVTSGANNIFRMLRGAILTSPDSRVGRLSEVEF